MTSTLSRKSPPPTAASAALTAVLGQRAATTPGDEAYRFLDDAGGIARTLSYAELDASARAVAGGLARLGAAGQPVLLAEPPGPDFITGLFACWYAGAIAVPAYPPRGSRHRRRLEAIHSDSGARLAIGDPAAPDPDGAWHRTAELAGLAAPHEGPARESDGPCLLQYTSGSTAAPKGVVLHHAQLRHHHAALARSIHPLSFRSALSWLPPYHDMGLVLKILFSLEAGIPLTCMTPDQFVQRPVRWLQAISRHRAELSGGPNFAYELCLRSVRDEDLAGLDLSCWKASPCGAERVRPDTLQRFARRFAPCGFDPRALMPGYGLAEATLTVSVARGSWHPKVSRHPETGSHVSCGPPLEGIALRIADPASGRTCGEKEIGEIRLSGPVVAAGYWNRPEESAAAFANGELRTGDRGYLENGELHVVGRIKDLIILDGTNHAPDDLEEAALAAAPEITAAAAFAIESADGERVVLALEAAGLAADRRAAFCAGLREALALSLEIPVHRIVLVRPGLLPRTTSGKIRRRATRDALETGTLALLRDDDGSTPPPAMPADESLVGQVLDAVHAASGRSGARPDDDLISFGLSSIEATRLSALISRSTGIALDHADLFSAPSFAHLAALIRTRTPSDPEPEILPGSGREAPLLSHSQERMWFLHRLEPESAAYHVFGALEMQGPLDLAALDRAFAEVTARHPILRSRHRDEAGIPVVSLTDTPLPPVEILHGPDPESLLRDFARRPFDLAADSPVRAVVIPLGPDRHLLGLCAHHIVADGWSIRILVRDLAACYAAFLTQSPPPALPAGPDFFDYAGWQRRRIDSGAADSRIAWWKDRLAGHPGKIDLATDFPRPPRPSSDGGAIATALLPDLAERIAALARRHRATPFMVQLAAFLLLLRQHGGGDDAVVAVPVANRHHAVAGDLVGTLVNTLPFRLPLDPAESFISLLERVRQASFEMQAAQEAPFERILEAVRPERSRDRAPLAQVMFDHQELPLPETWAGGLRCHPVLAHRGAVQFDLSLMVFVLPDRQQVVLEYRADLFREETATAMLGRYLETLDRICRDPARPLHAIDGLSTADQRKLAARAHGVQRPDFPLQTTPALIAASVARHPSRTAFETPGGSLDYAALDRRSTALATSLAARGVRPGDRVALLLERDLLLPVALLAVWKSGAAYVPLDAANPPERLALILADQQPVHILASPALAGHLPDEAAPILLERGLLENDPPAPLPHPPGPADPAYILYTSGSTGRPKGVVVPHGALANFLLSMAEEPGFREGERLLALTTVSFDISALELFLPLVAGGTVDLADGKTARDPAALIARIGSSRPDVLQATPATWRMLLDAGWTGSDRLRLFCGGEALDLPLARRLAALGREAWNLYGPTETTVWSTLWRIPENPDLVRIGHPIANTGVLILSPDGMPLPPGVPGELHLSGAGLALGYWNRPDLTDAAFVRHPGLPRLYRTGDLARWLPDGSLECLGRIDSQVKIRGFRVELGEIDAALLSHVGVAEAAALPAPSGDRLIAYYRPVLAGLDPAELLDHLRERLPDYMVPAPLIALDHLPLTSSGKIDRKALAARPLAASASAPAPTANDPLTAELAAIWGRVLDCRGVGPDDDFFSLGGHSLLAARLVAETARHTGITVPLDWLFDRPTPAGMAARLREKAAPDLARPRLIPLQSGPGGTPLFWVHTLVDGGMGLFPYRETARLLGPVTDSIGIAEGTRAFDSIREMAAAHVALIRRHQPHGPYRLAGFCFGGNLAAEIACQLADAGEKVGLLALLEATPPGSAPGPSRWLQPATWRHVLSRLPGRVASLFSRDTATAFRRLRMKHRAAASGLGRLVGSEAIPDIRGVLDLDLLDPESRDRATRHWEALHRHAPRLPAADRLVLVRASDPGWLPRPRLLGWKAPGPVEVLTVPGSHEDFLRNHSAREVAGVLQPLFEGDPPPSPR